MTSSKLGQMTCAARKLDALQPGRSGFGAAAGDDSEPATVDESPRTPNSPERER